MKNVLSNIGKGVLVATGVIAVVAGGLWAANYAEEHGGNQLDTDDIADAADDAVNEVT